MSCAPTVESIQLIMPPKLEPKPLGAYIHEPFNCLQYAVCHGRHAAAFNSDEACQMVISDPKLSETVIGTAVKTVYCLRWAESSALTAAGSLVLHPSSLCPTLEWCENQNLFQQLFGVEFHNDGHTYV